MVEDHVSRKPRNYSCAPGTHKLRVASCPVAEQARMLVQFRSKRIQTIMAIGYQADMGDPEWWAAYDESRRKVMAKAVCSGEQGSETERLE